MMRSILPANRVAALATWLTALGAFITAIEGTFPQTWQNTALAIAGVLGTLVTALHFMSGSQKFDALTAATQNQPGVHESQVQHGLSPEPENAASDIADPPVA